MADIRRLIATGILNPLKFSQKVRNLFGTSIVAYYPLWEPSGTVATDIVNGYNGTYSNVTLAQTGIGDGRTAALFVPASNSYMKFQSTAFQTAFKGQEVTVLIFVKPSAVGVWTDGTLRYFVNISNSGYTQYLRLRRNTTNQTLEWFYLAAGVTKNPTYIHYPTVTDWFMMGITVSLSNDRIRTWLNGQQITEVNTIPTWTEGNLSGSQTNLGNFSNAAPAAVWDGSLAHCVILNREATPAEILKFQNFHLIPKKNTVLGDSISADTTDGWQEMVHGTYNKGAVWKKNYSVGGMGIIVGATNMAAQVASAASDDADNILIMLGTNDTETGDTLRSTYETNLNTLKASNPRARIFGIGILNRTDMTGVATKNTRIQTACTNAGVTYKDATGVIDPVTDTDDGLHPNAAGNTKIANWALTWL